MLPANTAAGPDEELTSGSMSIADSGPALRLVAANVRALFVREAARRLENRCRPGDRQGGPNLGFAHLTHHFVRRPHRADQPRSPSRRGGAHQDTAGAAHHRYERTPIGPARQSLPRRARCSIHAGMRPPGLLFGRGRRGRLHRVRNSSKWTPRPSTGSASGLFGTAGFFARWYGCR